MSRAPLATYRVQLHADFDFDAAGAIADYIRDLGVSHIYCSPYLQAAPGSMHGYDVVNHHKVNEELGGSVAFERFNKRLGDCKLGQVLDIVPNHMAIAGRRNPLWWDILENGPSSRYAQFFDIDWQSAEQKMHNKVLAPILGEHYGVVLSKGDIKLIRHCGEFLITYFDHQFPVSPESLSPLLSEAAKKTGSDYLAFLADSLERLPAPNDQLYESRVARHRDKEVIIGLLCRLCDEVPFISEAVDQSVAALSAKAEAMDDLLEGQNYRLAFWRTAGQELGYRRFFDVNTLIGLRMENKQVFDDTHALILSWLREGVLDGVRIDHPDGLRDPQQYFNRLQEAAPDAYVVVEKILEPGERMRTSWPVDGTTGYDFLNEVAGLFVDPRGKEELTKFYAEFTGEPTDYAEVCREKKHIVAREILGSDVNRLTGILAEICENNRNHRDYTRIDLMRTIRELAACFPVYRTYVVPKINEIEADDFKYIGEAVETAKNHRPDLDPQLFDLLLNLLTNKAPGDLEAEFVMRFQQFTGPVMAKGVEDTVFYGYNRLTSLNEVGGDPGRFGVSVDEFHQFCGHLQDAWPNTMLASSTHDTKRSEDVRARLHVLSEIPGKWAKAVKKWSKMNEKQRSNGLPDRNTEQFLYQSMVGTWPVTLDRIQAYMEKATREAKQHTSWLDPNEEFDKAVKSFAEGVFKNEEFLKDLESFVESIREPGYINSLSLALLKLTAPGVPDIYQGNEIWDFSLVDPDNRRPVDYELRRRLLAETDRMTGAQTWKRMAEGLPKLKVTREALKVRREKPDCFNEKSSYHPIAIQGLKADNLVAFLRGESVLVLAPRLVTGLGEHWSTTSVDVPQGTWRNVFSDAEFEGGKLRMRDVLEDFPVGLLVRQ